MLRLRIDIGPDLLADKEQLSHGSFLSWIEAEFGMGKSSADCFMQMANVYPGKFPRVGNLDVSALYELVAPKTPPEVREAVEEMRASGEFIRREAGPRVQWSTLMAEGPP